MASIAEIGAKESKKPENQENDVTIYFGIFFDGTNNHRLQVLIGKMYRKKQQSEKGHKDLVKILNKFNKNEVDVTTDQFGTTIIEAYSGDNKELNEALAEYNRKYGNHLTKGECEIIDDFELDEVFDKNKFIKSLNKKQMEEYEQQNDENKQQKWILDHLNERKKFIHKDDVQADSDFTNNPLAELN